MRWLLRNRTERCPANRNLFDWVADHGHLDVIKVLHEARIEGCSARAMNWAAKNGHLETVIWLHENRAEVRRRDQDESGDVMPALQARPSRNRDFLCLFGFPWIGAGCREDHLPLVAVLEVLSNFFGVEAASLAVF